MWVIFYKNYQKIKVLWQSWKKYLALEQYNILNIKDSNLQISSYWNFSKKLFVIVWKKI